MKKEKCAFFKPKWLFILLVLLMLLTGVILVLSLNLIEKKHEEEIRNVISSYGGQVIKIEKVDPKLTPFAEDFNKSNVIYKVSYKKSHEELIAWYRGVNVVNNIHAENPTALQGGFAEKWIIPSEMKD
ncbi:hypothetical protein HZF08_03165 [Paenibacillus sp. CGMCC 1.16610]|uniref:DUF3139 domain-containing protein n=1 Tax=Paenibacillus anseongense TaxID=2682845 RepID=A0ABW9UAP4_9BACL|nr:MULTISPECIES: hypothetical protein [Paenibacillus]MBA2937292.1 hypothetical protein [Paenibacillus sp. CGMCC 1.16610]MVQ36350.1 hypothetical protein [Paenibacillus anseongense]